MIWPVSTSAERQARHDELDAVISDWARDRDPQDAMEVLQEAGVPAGRVLDSGDIHDDPQLLRRHFWVYLPHPRMHRYKQAGIPWRLVECNPTLQRHAPLFGEHTREILSTLGGLGDDEIDALYEAGRVRRRAGEPRPGVIPPSRYVRGGAGR